MSQCEINRAYGELMKLLVKDGIPSDGIVHIMPESRRFAKAFCQFGFPYKAVSNLQSVNYQIESLTPRGVKMFSALLMAFDEGPTPITHVSEMLNGKLLPSNVRIFERIFKAARKDKTFYPVISTIFDDYRLASIYGRRFNKIDIMSSKMLKEIFVETMSNMMVETYNNVSISDGYRKTGNEIVIVGHPTFCKARLRGLHSFAESIITAVDVTSKEIENAACEQIFLGEIAGRIQNVDRIAVAWPSKLLTTKLFPPFTEHDIHLKAIKKIGGITLCLREK
jgi:hypothetical protein